jgi:hypothetical protein
MWYLDCFIGSDLKFAVNSYNYDTVEAAILAGKDVLERQNITGIYAVDIYSGTGTKRRFYNSKDLNYLLIYS